MTSIRRYRSIATLATATLIAGGSLGSVAHAAEPARASSTQARGLFDGLVGGILQTVVSAAPAQVQEQLAPLTGAQTAALLGAADPAQLDSLLAVITPAQLAGALGGLGGGDLTNVVSGLSPDAITGLLGMTGGFDSVLSGLTGSAAGLGAGGTPDPTAVAGLVDQLTALLGGGLGGATPAQFDQLASLLSSLPGLVSASNLDPTQLSGLLGTVTGLLGGAAAGTPAAAPLQQLLGALTGLGANLPGAGPKAPATPAAPAMGAKPPVAPTVPAGSSPGASSGQSAEPFRAYRARAGGLRLSKSRRTASVLVKCPVNAPVGCLVYLTSDVAGRRSSTKQAVALLKGTQKRFSVRLTKAAAKRLNKHGGTVRVKAKTLTSTLASSTKSKKVRRTAR